MTVDFSSLTAQIHRWLNKRVAELLAAQAEKFTH